MSQITIAHKLIGKLRKFKTKLTITAHEHTKQLGSKKITYLFYRKHKSKKLVVIFSGMHKETAVYNYIKTLDGISHNRLYILDNHGVDKLGCYYIGANGQNDVYLAVRELVDSVRKKYSIDQLIFCGSSKGGHAALNFGLNYPDATIIAGAPQYKLGYYLTHRRSDQLLHSIAGDHPADEYIAYLDNTIEEKLRSNAGSFSGNIFLHYSDQEHTYSEHIQPMLGTLSSYQYTWNEDVMHYVDHDDVAIHLPSYLRSTIDTL